MKYLVILAVSIIVGILIEDISSTASKISSLERKTFELEIQCKNLETQNKCTLIHLQSFAGIISATEANKQINLAYDELQKFIDIKYKKK